MRVGIVLVFLALFSYTLVGTGTRVDEIKERAPAAISERGWAILRYEGYQWGAWSKHGGKVWYHVKDRNHKNTYYRVHVTLWSGELHFYYNKPEQLQRINLDSAESGFVLGVED